MKILSASCDQIEQWLCLFKSSENPEDLVVVEDPRLFLSCRLSGAFSGKAYACFSDEAGNELAEEISESDEVYAIAAENCSAMANYEIATQVEKLICARKSVEAADVIVFSRTIEMLKALDRKRGDLDLRAWFKQIGNLPGSNHSEIQTALRLAGDLHANMLNNLEIDL
jgi:hypothetical protein